MRLYDGMSVGYRESKHQGNEVATHIALCKESPKRQVHSPHHQESDKRVQRRR